jgi:ubiquinone/menaquinone biosynthesis C-methylase UbiE
MQTGQAMRSVWRICGSAARSVCRREIASDQSDRDNIVRKYDRLAPFWGRLIEKLGYPAAYRLFVSKAIHGQIAFRHGQRLCIVDVGTGDGALALALKEKFGHSISLDLLDPSAPMLAIAQKRLAEAGQISRVFHGYLGDVHLEPRTYDIVSAAHVIEHMPDHGDAMRCLFELLKPGGTLLLVVSQPHWCSRIVWLRWRHRVFKAQTIIAALRATGFDQVQSIDFERGPPSRLSIGYIATRRLPPP